MREKNIENLRTEKEGLIVLNQLIDNLIIPTKEQIIFLYELLNIDYKKYFKSIDAIALKVKTFDLIKTKNDFFLLEVKTTQAKHVKTLPYGVFFGFTKNEEDLFKSHDNYRFMHCPYNPKKTYIFNLQRIFSSYQKQENSISNQL